MHAIEPTVELQGVEPNRKRTRKFMIQIMFISKTFKNCHIFQYPELDL